MRRGIAVALLAFAGALGWASGTSESAAASSGRGTYLAGQGVIMPASEVRIDSTVAHMDYRYPRPEGALGVSVYTGHRQVSSLGQDEVVQIGIQGGGAAFDELKPLNIAFVIDRSGSMADRNKLDWVKQAFDVFISKVRERDFVSVVAFNDSAAVVFPSTGMGAFDARERFRRAVAEVRPGGGTNIPAGLKLGYEQVMSNYRAEYTNRVFLLTDALLNQGSKQGMIEMAAAYRAMGINVSAIGVGDQVDLKLLDAIASAGGGSSRFISDEAEMERTFGSGLARMAVPSAREVSVTLALAPGVRLLGTWGYEHKVQGTRVSYFLPTLHYQDYETILAQVRLPKVDVAGPFTIARLSVSYKDLSGTVHVEAPREVQVEVVDGACPVAGFSDGMVLRSGTMLRFAQTVQEIGRLYYGGGKRDKALELAAGMRNELMNVRLRLQDQGFDDEISMMEKYIDILGGEARMSDRARREVLEDVEVAPPAPQLSLDAELKGLLREVALEMTGKPPGVVAVSGFTVKKEPQPGLVSLLNEMSLQEMSAVRNLRAVERERLDAVLQEQQLALSDLVDTTRAISVGRLLSARYILTGTLVDMPSSVVIFARVVNVETAEIESAAQVIVPKTQEVRALL